MIQHTNASPNTRAVISSIALCIFTMLVLTLMALHGRNSRIVNRRPVIEPVPVMQAAFDVWKRHGLKGRILIYGDRHLTIQHPVTDRQDPERYTADVVARSAERYVYAATLNNTVRAIYHIIPDPAWDEVERTLLQFPLVTYRAGVFRTMAYDGIPLHITRAKDLPRFDEPVLLHLNDKVLDDGFYSAIGDMLRDKTMTTDMITIYGDDSGARARLLRSSTHDH